MSSTQSAVRTRYQAKVAAQELREDPAQIAAIEAFERLEPALNSKAGNGNGGGLRGLFRKKAEAPKGQRGLYLWGGVGRGKSMLMDIYFETAPVERKRRVHFHAFMQEIHAGMHAARQTGVSDALEPVAEQVIGNARLLCFDEMQITDITDAMIVGRLFEKLFAGGVVVVVTSNRPPDDLYKDGLNRNLFLPFIDLLKERMEVHELGSQTDYRQNRLEGHKSYFTPIDEAAEMAIARVWTDLVGQKGAPLVLHHKGREIVLPEYHSGVARATFLELCGQPLGPGDYLKIAEAVRVLILQDIPRLSRARNNEAKRFVTLIDALYEARVRLIVSAADIPEELYAEGEGAFEFERTASRLREMMSADWAADA